MAGGDCVFGDTSPAKYVAVTIWRDVPAANTGPLIANVTDSAPDRFTTSTNNTRVLAVLGDANVDGVPTVGVVVLLLSTFT